MPEKELRGSHARYNTLPRFGTAKTKRALPVFDTLKEKAPKDLDKIVQEVHADVFSEIDCTQCAIAVRVLGLCLQSLILCVFQKHFA